MYIKMYIYQQLNHKTEILKMNINIYIQLYYK